MEWNPQQDCTTMILIGLHLWRHYKQGSQARGPTQIHAPWSDVEIQILHRSGTTKFYSERTIF